MQGVCIAQVVNALGFAEDLHLGEFLLRSESLHHGIALNLGVVEVVFLDGHEGVGEGLETANFLLLHLHFHGIATESGQGVPQHRLAAKIEGRIAAVGGEFAAGARGGLLGEGHVMDGLQCDGFAGIAVVVEGIGFDAEQVFAAALVGQGAVPHREGFGVAAVVGMFAPNLPLVECVVDVDMSVRQPALLLFVEQEGIAEDGPAGIEEGHAAVKFAFLGFGEVVAAVEDHGAGFVIELGDGKKLRFFKVGAVLQRIGFNGIVGGGEHHILFEEEGFEGGVIAALE